MPGSTAVALGLKVRTGRAIVVVLRGPADAPVVVVKHRIDVATTFAEGAVYHTAQGLPLAQARERIAASEQSFTRRATDALAAVLRPLQVQIVAAALVAPAPKPAPPMPQILKAHPLVHAAEIELYRRVFGAAAAQFGTTPARIPEDQLGACAASALGLTPTRLDARFTALGRSAGRPWAADHKHAALAAWIALAQSGA